MAFCATLAAVVAVPTGVAAQDPPTCNGLVATIVGTDGDDVLQGTFRDDVIVGLGGNDTINGASGSDTICGGDGDDVINGGSQDDVIFGGAGADTIRGESGADVIDGGAGDDTLSGESQNDTIQGGDGDDDINGGSGDDTLDGGNGVDVVNGLWQNDTCDDAETAINCETETNNGENGGGDPEPPVDTPTCDGLPATIVGTDGDDVIEGTFNDDVIVGLGGDDTITGLSGADVICGGEGDDIISGGSQNDVLFGDAGDDTLNGGSGDDTLNGGDGFDVVDGGTNNDICEAGETVPNCETVPDDGNSPLTCNGLTATIVGTDGDDVLQGTFRDDVIVGLGGNDTINGASGSDTICGGDGDDVINGGSQDDVIFGGAGADTIRGESGADVIDGGAGDDTLSGESQNDTIQGGDGDDDINGGSGDDTLDGGNGIDVVNGLWQNDTCDDAETAINCETETNNGENGGAAVTVDVTPIFECWARNADGSFSAYFGYENASTTPDGQPTAVEIEAGSRNTLSDTALNGILPTVFTVGRTASGETEPNAFVVLDWNRNDIVWTLNDTTASASTSGTECASSVAQTTDPWEDPAVTILPDQPGPATTSPFSFAVGERAGDVRLLVDSNGDLFSFDIEILPAQASAVASGVLVSEPVDLVLHPAAPPFAGAELTMTYDDSAVPPGSLVRIRTFNPATQDWTVVPGDQLADPDRSELTVSLDHFSCYAVFASPDLNPLPAGPDGDCEATVESFAAGFSLLSDFGVPESVLLQPSVAQAATPLVDSSPRTRRMADGSIQYATVAYSEALSLNVDGSIDTSAGCSSACQAASQLDAEDLLAAASGQGVFRSMQSSELSNLDVQHRLIRECIDLAVAPGPDCNSLIEGSPSGEDGGSDVLAPSGRYLYFSYEGFSSTSYRIVRDLFFGSDSLVVTSAGAKRLYATWPPQFSFAVLSPESIAQAGAWAGLIKLLFEERAQVAATLGSTPTLAELRAARTDQSLSPELRSRITTVDSFLNAVIAEQDAASKLRGWYPTFGISPAYVRNTYLRFALFDTDDEAADLLLSFPSVTDDGSGGYRQFATTAIAQVPLATFSSFEEHVRRMSEAAFQTADDQDRRLQHEMVLRMPETNAGIRNSLITAVYSEHAAAVQSWVDGGDRTSSNANERPVIWGSIAQWASAGVGEPISGNVPWLADIGGAFAPGVVQNVRQAGADGNQWIFGDALRHYAYLLDLIETNPNPSVEEWEEFFTSDHWADHDRIARNGMVALVASRYANDPYDQQRLALLHTAAFGDVEQSGAQIFLNELGTPGFFDELGAIFVDVRMGNVVLGVTDPVGATYGAPLASLSDPNDLPRYFTRDNVPFEAPIDLNYWAEPWLCSEVGPGELCSDPSSFVFDYDRLSEYYDTEIDFEFSAGGADTSLSAVNLGPLGTYDERDFYSASFDVWRNEGDQGQPDLEPVYYGSAADDWVDFDERMWFLFNLFRTNIMDQSIKTPAYSEAATQSADRGATFDNRGEFSEENDRPLTRWSQATIDKLSVDTFGDTPIVAPTVDDRAVINVEADIEPNPAQPGQRLAVSFEVSNTGTLTGQSVELVIQVPAGFTLQPPYNTSCVFQTAVLLRCTLGDLPAGEATREIVQLFIPDGYDLDGRVIRFGSDEAAAPATLTDEIDLSPPPFQFALPCLLSCSGGGTSGDPHLVSLDGLAFDLQTVGEQVLAISDDGSVEVQVRTRGFGGNRVSVNSAVAARVGGDVVELALGAPVLLNGEAVEVTSEAPLDLGAGAFVSRTGRYYNVVWPGTGDRPVLRIRVAGSYMNVGLLFPDSMAGEFSGLLGDGDGDRSNDFAFRDGTVIPQPATAATLHTVFADAWRISDAESLFTYSDGVGTADFTNLDFPSGGFVRLEDFDPAVIQAARVQCEQAGITDPVLRDWCALDLIVTQDPSFLTGYLGAVLPAGGGPLNTVRGADGEPVLIDGVEDIRASVDGSVLYAALPGENKIITVDPVTGETADYAVVDAPTDLAIDSEGNLFAVTLGELPSGPEGPGTGFVTRIDADTGAQSVVSDELKLPVDVEITPDGGLLYVHERGLNWFGGAASGVRTVDTASGVSTRVFNARRLNSMSGLSMDGDGRAFWETRNLRFSHTPADGVQELASVDNRVSTITTPDGERMFYTRIGGAFGGCSPRDNVFLYVEEIDAAGVPLGGRVNLVGGVDKVGFSDSTFNDPLGRMCWDSLALTLDGNRIYINDAGNDAIRYVTYNP